MIRLQEDPLIQINSNTSLFGLFGNPVKHSLSPVMHQAAFNSLGLNAVYLAFQVEEAYLREAVGAIRALSIRGVNVTIPYKVDVISFLDEVDEEALRIGAVNTIRNLSGRLIGYNTDGIGYIRSLQEAFHPDFQEMNVTILGAGGAVRSVAYSLARQDVRRITIVNRDQEKAKNLSLFLSSICPVHVAGWEELEAILKETDLLINGTPVGMHPHIENTPVPKDMLHPDMIVSDLIYTPFTTRLLKEAEEQGAAIHRGLKMLLYQGVLAFEIWTGLPAPIEVMEKALYNHLRKNGEEIT